MNKGWLLISRMAETYYPPHKGMNTMTLCQITPRYSQSFGDWKRDHGIIVDKVKSDDGHTYNYYLRTDPTTFDWDTLKPVVPHERKRRTGRKVAKVEAQEGLAL